MLLGEIDFADGPVVAQADVAAFAEIDGLDRLHLVAGKPHLELDEVAAGIELEGFGDAGIGLDTLYAGGVVSDYFPDRNFEGVVFSTRSVGDFCDDRILFCGDDGDSTFCFEGFGGTHASFGGPGGSVKNCTEGRE